MLVTEVTYNSLLQTLAHRRDYYKVSGRSEEKGKEQGRNGTRRREEGGEGSKEAKRREGGKGRKCGKSEEQRKEQGREESKERLIAPDCVRLCYFSRNAFGTLIR